MNKIENLKAKLFILQFILIILILGFYMNGEKILAIYYYILLVYCYIKFINIK